MLTHTHMAQTGGVHRMPTACTPRHALALPSVVSMCLACLVIVWALGGGHAYVGSPLAVVGALVAGLGILALLGRETFGNDHVGRRWFLMGSMLVLTIACSIAILWFAPTAEQNLDMYGFWGGADKERYERYGWLIAREGMGGLAQLPLNDVGPVILTAVAYSLFGRTVVAVAVFQVLFHAWVSIGLYRLVCSLGNQRDGRRAMLLWMLLPLPIFYASFPNKEIPLTALLLSGTNAMLRLQGREVHGRIGAILWIILAGTAMVFFRSRMAFVYVASILGIGVLRASSAKRIWSVITIVFVAMVTAGAMTIAFGPELWTLHAFDIGDAASVIGQSRFGIDASSLSVRLYWNGNWRRAYLILFRLPFSIWFPYPPFGFGSWESVLNSLNAWALIGLAPSVAAALTSYGSLHRDGGWGLEPLWVPPLLLASALAAGQAYMQARYAIPAYPFITALAALGIGQRDALRRWCLPVIAVVILSFVAYFVLKGI